MPKPRRKVNRKHPLTQLAVNHGLPGPKQKHGNQKITVDGVKFDSQREYRRWHELQCMERQGQISQLQRQVAFELIPAVILDGRKKPVIKYVADFRYFQHEEFVVEDAKSPHLRVNPVYRIKKHLMKHIHNIEIKEV